MEVSKMKRTQLLQEIKKMRFGEIYDKWTAGRLTQCEAAEILGISDRTLRRQIRRYEADGLEGLIDHRIEKVSHRKAGAAVPAH
jgi:DNA-binding NtrC family response regulator